MQKLAESSGTVVYETGSKLYISKRPAKWTANFLFVSGLLAFILLANGVLQLLVFNDQVTGSSGLAIIFFLTGFLFAIIFWRVKLHQRKARAIPLNELEKIGIFDFESNNLLDDQQNILTSLSKAWLMRKMQMTSSSPELIISWDSGHLSIVKGNPFSGGIAAIENILISKGVKKR